jgi:hypothetical protein
MSLEVFQPHQIPNVDALILRQGRRHLFLDDAINRGPNHLRQIGIVIQQGIVAIRVIGLTVLLVAESSQFMRPLHINSRIAAIIFGDAKEFFNRRDDGNQRVAAAGKQIEGDDALVGPGMERNMRFQQDADTGDSLGNELVTMITQHGQTGRGNRVDHGLRQAFFAIQKVTFNSLDIDKQVL